MPTTHQCFLEFAESILPQSVLRAAITAAYRRPRAGSGADAARAGAPAGTDGRSHQQAGRLDCRKLRNQKSAGGRAGIVQGLLQEFSCRPRKAWR
jgi:RHH-type proline utilization regulon transcriptional repressor/proline dehydrogenase/delta 1-pyrroline-5-carboxylate dehydrogenase